MVVITRCSSLVVVWYGPYGMVKFGLFWYLECLSPFAPLAGGVGQVVVDGWFVKDEQIQEVDGDWVE